MRGFFVGTIGTQMTQVVMIRTKWPADHADDGD